LSTPPVDEGVETSPVVLFGHHVRRRDHRPCDHRCLPIPVGVLERRRTRAVVLNRVRAVVLLSSAINAQPKLVQLIS
jgi:hypothetical protein